MAVDGAFGDEHAGSLRTYPLSEAPEAISYLEQGHVRGKVVITVLRPFRGNSAGPGAATGNRFVRRLLPSELMMSAS